MTGSTSLLRGIDDIGYVDVDGIQKIAPRSVDEIVSVVEALKVAGVKGLPLGAGSTFENLPPPDVNVIVSASAYAGLIDYQPDDLTVVVRAGTTLGDLSGILEAKGQTAVLPERSPERTVGGVVSSGASGFGRLRYGPTRDRVLGVTLVTGYGRPVKGGGALVKNVTGYDLPRLCTGSHGTLGFIADICLKLWPIQPASRTIEVADADESRSATYKPLAVLETPDAVTVMVEGSEASVSDAEGVLDGASRTGLLWPDPPCSAVNLSVRVPASFTSSAVSVVRGTGAEHFVAQHGIGRIDAGFASLPPGALEELRARVGELHGIATITGWKTASPMPDRWGMTPGGGYISERLTSLFDPAGVFRIGQLPGGL